LVDGKDVRVCDWIEIRVEAEDHEKPSRRS
jgi:hypothetical protein